MIEAGRSVGGGGSSVEMEQLWFELLRRRAWSSLVLIPAHAGDSALGTARALAAIGERHLGRRLAVITDCDPASLRRAARMPALVGRELHARPEGPAVDWDTVFGDTLGTPGEPAGMSDVSKSPTVIVPLEPVVSNPQGIAVALAADAALLCVTLNGARVRSARRTIELVGRDRFIGCVVRHD